MKINKNKFFLQPLKTIAVVGFSFFIVWGYAKTALNLSCLNPISELIKNFSITDMYYLAIPEKENRYLTLVDFAFLRDRSEIARVIEEIEECHPAVIGMDCTFKNTSSDTLGDNAIKRIAERYKNIVFSYELQEEQSDDIGYTRSIHSFFTEEIPVHEGAVNMQRDNLYNGIKRTLKLGWLLNEQKVPSFVGEVYNYYIGKKEVTPEDNDVKINFAPTNFTVINSSEILLKKEKIEGRLVFISSMTDERDMHYTPLGKMSGVMLNAYAIQTLFEKKQIIEPPMWLQVFLSVLLVTLTNLLQLTYLKWTSKNKSPMVYHVMGSAYVLGLITVLWIALVLWVTFLCFCLYKINLEIGWAIAAMAFLAISRSFYAACEDYYKLWRGQKP